MAHAQLSTYLVNDQCQAGTSFDTIAQDLLGSDIGDRHLWMDRLNHEWFSIQSANHCAYHFWPMARTFNLIKISALPQEMRHHKDRSLQSIYKLYRHRILATPSWYRQQSTIIHHRRKLIPRKVQFCELSRNLPVRPTH